MSVVATRFRGNLTLEPNGELWIILIFINVHPGLTVGVLDD